MDIASNQPQTNLNSASNSQNNTATCSRNGTAQFTKNIIPLIFKGLKTKSRQTFTQANTTGKIVSRPDFLMHLLNEVARVPENVHQISSGVYKITIKQRIEHQWVTFTQISHTCICMYMYLYVCICMCNNISNICILCVEGGFI